MPRVATVSGYDHLGFQAYLIVRRLRSHAYSPKGSEGRVPSEPVWEGTPLRASGAALARRGLDQY